MPITYWVDVENRVVMATALGILADADLPPYLGAVTTDPDVEPGFNELFDIREVTEVEITVSGIEDLADRALLDFFLRHRKPFSRQRFGRFVKVENLPLPIQVAVLRKLNSVQTCVRSTRRDFVESVN